MRKKAILAIAFASGLAVPSTPTIAQEQNNFKSIVSQLSTSKEDPPEVRAHLLLKFAISCLNGIGQSAIEKQFSPESIKVERRFSNRRLELYLSLTAELQYIEATSNKSPKLSAEDLTLATLAVNESLKQVGLSNNHLQKSRLTCIAACLYKRLGNKAGEQDCERILNAELENAEKSAAINAEQADTALTILDARAYGLIPVRIQDYYFGKQPKYSDYSDADFKACEKLKLEGLSIADKLPTTEHVRRKAHRDLVLWYRTLGKEDLAKAQLQTLYKLVNFKDESVLYPHSKGCGKTIWWRRGQKMTISACGMG